MPELPEVETVRRSLASLVGRRVAGCRLNRSDILTRQGKRRSARLCLLEHGRIAGMNRRGKQLALIADDGRVLVIHLGMSGQLLLHAGGERPERADHIHATWSFDDETSLLFRDPRRFGGLLSLPTLADLDHHWSALGPDGLDADAEHLQASAGRSARAIKAVLLDQSVLAGVGNIYADESLFSSRIRPTRSAKSLKAEDWARLSHAIRQVLHAAIEARGSTLRDYRDANGHGGSAQLTHRVYGRGGLPCSVCSHPLISTISGQRTTVYCPHCQC